MPLAPTVAANGADIPAIGLGTWPLTGEACAQAVQWAIAAGYRHIDTAAIYGNEDGVGAGIRASGHPRDDIFVTTKVWHENLVPAAFARSVEASLKRLALGHVDLLLIHWPDPKVPLADTIGALCEAKRAGRTRHVGVANFPSTLLAEAVALSTEPLVVDQCESHPYLDQGKVKAMCRGQGLAFVAYTPLGRTAMLGDPAIREIAAAHGRTPAQIVLRWHVQQPGTVAIPKSGNRERIAENIQVFDFTLSDDDMTRISALGRSSRRVVTPDFAPRWDE